LAHIYYILILVDFTIPKPKSTIPVKGPAVELKTVTASLLGALGDLRRNYSIPFGSITSRIPGRTLCVAK